MNKPLILTLLLIPMSSWAKTQGTLSLKNKTNCSISLQTEQLLSTAFLSITPTSKTDESDQTFAVSIEDIAAADYNYLQKSRQYSIPALINCEAISHTENIEITLTGDSAAFFVTNHTPYAQANLYVSGDHTLDANNKDLMIIALPTKVSLN